MNIKIESIIFFIYICILFLNRAPNVGNYIC